MILTSNINRDKHSGLELMVLTSPVVLDIADLHHHVLADPHFAQIRAELVQEVASRKGYTL